MNLLNMLTSVLTTGPALDALASKTGISKRTLKAIIIVAVPILLQKLTSNASSKEGAQSLLGALGQHKSTRAIENQLDEADEEDGAKILGHIFGADKDRAVRAVAKEADASEEEVTKVLGNISPSLLSSLSAATTSASKQQSSGLDLTDGFDMKDVMGLMGMVGGGQQSSSGSGGLLGALLGGQQQPDQSNDGTQLLNSLLSMMK